MSVASSKPLEPSARVRAEAAVWVARLHSTQRSSQVEAGLRQWLAESEERRLAFELVTETWETATRLPRRAFERGATRDRFRLSMTTPGPAFVTAMVLIVATITTLFYLRRESIATEIGEQRMLTLQDGTRVYLNTDTELMDRYDKHVRRVELKKGEALFDVARQQNKPFIVMAGDREIRALGTQFVVRRDAGNLAVTLVEGKVQVTPAAPSSRAVVLSPGQRLTFEAHESPKMDTPAIERVTAWQRGRIVLDNTSLSDAAAEMNRYSTRRLVVEEPALTIRVSGRFRAGDQEDFARAVAKAYRLSVRAEPQKIVIAGSPDAPRAVP